MVKIPPQFAEARFIRLQCEGVKSLQVAGVQVIKVGTAGGAKGEATAADSTPEVSASQQENEPSQGAPASPQISYFGNNVEGGSSSSHDEPRRDSSLCGGLDENFYAYRPSIASPTRNVSRYHKRTTLT